MSREMPANHEAEACCLSALAWQPRDAMVIFDLLASDDFDDDAHRRIFDGAVVLNQRGMQISTPNLMVVLRELGHYEGVGGANGIMHVLDSAPGVANIEQHARLVLQKSRLRRLIRECSVVLDQAYSSPRDVDGFIDDAEQRIYAATGERAGVSAEWIGDLALAESRHVVAVREGERLPAGIPYGLSELDTMTGGMRPGEVTVVAARPGMGKTALAVNVATNVARMRHGGIVHGVVFASLEMTSAQVVRRSISSAARISQRDVVSKARVPDDSESWNRYVESVNTFVPLPIKLDDTTRMRPSQVRSLVRRVRATFDKASGIDGMPQQLSVVVIDYLQRMGADRQRKDRHVEVADNMNAVADMAKDLGVHVVLLAQINRENTKRDGKSKRPRMSDLAESGEIEKSAHTIVLLHRPEYYVQDKRQVQPHEDGLAELIVDKQREGETGIAMAAYDRRYTLFRDPTEDELLRWSQAPSESVKARAPRGFRSAAS